MSQVIVNTLRIAVLIGLILKTKNIIRRLKLKNVEKYNPFNFLAEICSMYVVAIVAYGI